MAFVLVLASGCMSNDSTSNDDEIDEGASIPETPVLHLNLSPIKQFDFSWAPASGASYYQLFERADVGEDFVQVGTDVLGEAVSLTVPLHFRTNASYRLLACNALGCAESAIVEVSGTLVEAIGVLEPSNVESSRFGQSVASSTDGRTLVVGAPEEEGMGAVHVFVRDAMDVWTEQARIQASNAQVDDLFGRSVALSADGDTLAIGAIGEGAAHVHERDEMGAWMPAAQVESGNPVDDDFGTATALSADGNVLAVGAVGDESSPGAAHVFVRDGVNDWSPLASLEGSNAGPGARFGSALALSADGNVLAVGADTEDGNSSDVGAAYVYERDAMNDWTETARLEVFAPQYPYDFGHGIALSADADTLAVLAGYGADSEAPVHVYGRDPMGAWEQRAVLSVLEGGAYEGFAHSLALSADGNVLAFGSIGDASNAIGLDGDPLDTSSDVSGATFVFRRDGMDDWTQRAYVKASNTQMGACFGIAVALSGDGAILAVGAVYEGAVYLY